MSPHRKLHQLLLDFSNPVAHFDHLVTKEDQVAFPELRLALGDVYPVGGCEIVGAAGVRGRFLLEENNITVNGMNLGLATEMVCSTQYKRENSPVHHEFHSQPSAVHSGRMDFLAVLRL